MTAAGASSEDRGDLAAPHQAYVDQLKRWGVIRTPLVEAAFRAIPRHLFVPGFPLAEVYSDRAINIKPGASSSQPTVYAMMLEQLQLAPGHRVLEIGAGTGYNAALMASIVGESGQVITIDIDEELAASAREHLAAAGFGYVLRVLCGDGSLGCPDAAPYDRIIVTVGAWDIAPAWREQLAPHGRLLVPLAILGPNHQVTVAFEPADDHLESVSISPCVFMMSRGAIAGPSGPPRSLEEIRIRAYPQEAEHAPPTDEVVLQKRWTRLVMSAWP
jgi:protein-L-isoaspartate(D-aspartate) O-methyltransferase